MGDRAPAILRIVLILAAACSTRAQDANQPASPPPADAPDAAIELAKYQNESSSVRIEPARMDSKPGIALIFEGTADLHYYAKPETAPAPGFELQVKAKSDNFDFAPAVFPQWGPFTDSLGNKIEVFSDRFVVFLPIARSKTSAADIGDVQVTISGIACTSLACLPPFEKTLQTTIDLSRSDSWKQISIQHYSIWFALPLAFLAGLILNIMPCVWPVLPLIVMRIVEQAKQAKGKSTAMGLTFCLGILLFFACLALANIILQIFYGTVLQWGDQFRNPAFLGGMSLLLVVLALSMFGIITITIPSSIAGKSGSTKGRSGPIGMGFLAAVLSTPCGFGVLAAAFGWAQAQHWLLATLAIMVIGVGMATPYAILTSIPALLKRLPKPGRWMVLFKQGIGFVLLGIAVKLISALPETRRADLLYFALVLAFSVWMWGKWTDYSTKPFRRRLVRIIAATLALGAGWVFLSPPARRLIDWHHYDAPVIDAALAEERPVLIKFTADWCFSCLVAEKVVYSRKDIAELIEQKNVLAIKADTTKKTYSATTALKNIYDEAAVPVSVLFLPGSKEPLRWHGFLFADKLEQSLTKITVKKENDKKGQNQ